MKTNPFVLKDFLWAFALPLMALGLQYYYYEFCIQLCRDCAPGTDIVIIILIGVPTIIMALNYLSLYKFQKIELYRKPILRLVQFSPLIFIALLFGIRGTVFALTILNYTLISITGLTLLITIGRGLMALKKKLD